MQGPSGANDTEDIDTFSIDNIEPVSDIVIEMEDIMLEDTIESTLLEDNSDIFDPSMPIPPANALKVPYVRFSYLYSITNGFDESRQIGKGGFSEVFRGETSRSKKQIAIKKLKDSPDAFTLMNFEGE